MGEVTIYLPDDLHTAAVGADVAISDVCREALEIRLGRLRESPFTRRPVRRPDESERFREGMQLGMRWGRRAPRSEVEEISAWHTLRWRQFSVDPLRNTLPAAYCAANGFEPPRTDIEFWFERDAYTAGVIEGVAAARSASPRP